MNTSQYLKEKLSNQLLNYILRNSEEDLTKNYIFGIGEFIEAIDKNVVFLDGYATIRSGIVGNLNYYVMRLIEVSNCFDFDSPMENVFAITGFALVFKQISIYISNPDSENGILFNKKCYYKKSEFMKIITILREFNSQLTN